ILIGRYGKTLIFLSLRLRTPSILETACPVLLFSVQLFVVGRVQLLIANSQVTRPETRTLDITALGLLVPGLFLDTVCEMPFSSTRDLFLQACLPARPDADIDQSQPE